MVECPKCKKEISELDEKCPYCNTEFEDMKNEVSEVTKVLKQITKENECDIEDCTQHTSVCNAQCLNVMAYINIILSIIGAIFVWCNFSTIEIQGKYSYILEKYTTSTEINWYGIAGGFGVLIAGFTLFFLLKTIIDIYWKVKSNE